MVKPYTAIWIVPPFGLSLAKQLIIKSQFLLQLNTYIFIYIYNRGKLFYSKSCCVSQFCVTALPSRFFPRVLLFIFPPLNDSRGVPHHGKMGFWAASRLPQISSIYFCYQDKPYCLVFSCCQIPPSSTPFVPYRQVVLISRELCEPLAMQFHISLFADELSPVLAKYFHLVSSTE